jgi:hypothetical protein
VGLSQNQQTQKIINKYKMYLQTLYMFRRGSRGGAVSCGTALQAGRSRVRFPICHWNFSLTLFFRSTQPLTEMSTRNIMWGKGGRCLGLITLPSCADYLGVSTSWNPKGLFRPVMGLLYLHICFGK